MSVLEGTTHRETRAGALVPALLAATAAFHHCSRLLEANKHTHTLENVVALLQSLEPKWQQPCYGISVLGKGPSGGQDLYVTAVGDRDSQVPQITKKGNIGSDHPAIGHKPETLISILELLHSWVLQRSRTRA